MAYTGVHFVKQQRLIAHLPHQHLLEWAAARRLESLMAQTPKLGLACVAAVRNETHSPTSLRGAVRGLLEYTVPPLNTLVRRGDRVLVKVNMGCSGLRAPEERVTTHPALVEAIIEALKDCGAIVSFGDDVARVGRYCPALWNATGMSDVARRTGAALIDFVAVGGREVRGGLVYPRSYLVTNAYLDADVVINAANCRSHPNIVLSGAIKNMFGCILGTRKQLIHELFWDNPSDFGRAIADVYRTTPADLSILDLTDVREGQGVPGVRPEIRKVGLLLAGTDPVALDCVAAHAVGYDQLPIWTTYHAKRMRLGESAIGKIALTGLDWDEVRRGHLRYPLLVPPQRKSLYELMSSFLNHTIFRLRPVIIGENCTGCGDCAKRCPVQSIDMNQEGTFTIRLRDCADCGCCVRVCESNAIALRHVGVARRLHGWKNWCRSHFAHQDSSPASFDN